MIAPLYEGKLSQSDKQTDWYSVHVSLNGVIPIYHKSQLTIGLRLTLESAILS